MHDLTKHEELILLSILKLSDDAYGVSIRRTIQGISGKSINYGSLSNTLYQLVRKKLIESRESDPVSQQGGRRKVLYSLTPSGKEALKRAWEVQQSAWDGVVDIVLESE